MNEAPQVESSHAKINEELEKFAFDGIPPRSSPPLVTSINITSRIPVDFCWIPPGEFIMGSPKDEPGRAENEDQARVRISKGFWMGKTEVTNAQWQAVMGGREPSERDANRPVDSISWEDCLEFISKLQKPPKGWRFDLPTEAQWEYACRAGTAGAYSGKLDGMAWYFENSNARSEPVARKKSNSWGLHDMHGNVFEWCKDFYGPKLPGGVDPFAKTNSESRLRVRKGGSWYYGQSACRSAYRNGEVEDFKTSNLGFRLALVPE